MPIRVLSDDTINKIAAGEVVERPLSIVKELLENAIDANASTVAIEVRDGGTSLIRITDDGIGIPFNEVRTAFRRHATSKITDADDLLRITTLGFRGEALASIAAVSAVELISKQKDALLAARYLIDGGIEQGLSEIGAPGGTTIIVRDLFKNVPARRKFLKSPTTESARIQEIVEMEALAHPEIAFRYLQDGRQKLSTLGNGKQKDVIYAIYGRDIAANLIELDQSCGENPETGRPAVRVRGYIGKPVITRSNRNFEISFVNGRYVRNQVITRALEDGYHAFLMQHKFPFAVLTVDVDPEAVDVNVHPQKMEVRFSDGQLIYNSVCDSVREALGRKELIVDAELPEQKHENEKQSPETGAAASARTISGGGADANIQQGISAAHMKKTSDNPLISAGNAHVEPFEQRREQALYADLIQKMQERSPQAGTGEPLEISRQEAPNAAAGSDMAAQHAADANMPAQEVSHANKAERGEADYALPAANKELADSGAPYRNTGHSNGKPRDAHPQRGDFDMERFAGVTANIKGEQQTLFAPEFLTEKARVRHRIIGQLFETYWLIEYSDKLYIIDQHAAHEKVMFERLMKRFRAKEPVSQYLNPPILLTLSAQEACTMEQFQENLEALGYEISHLGERDYSVTAVPADLPSIAKKELLLEMFDSLSEEARFKTADTVYDKIASMSCKAAVKGNNRLSMMEADALIEELLGLENPYACPHGRPTIISMSHYELDKKFKRIV